MVKGSTTWLGMVKLSVYDVAAAGKDAEALGRLTEDDLRFLFA